MKQYCLKECCASDWAHMVKPAMLQCKDTWKVSQTIEAAKILKAER